MPEAGVSALDRQLLRLIDQPGGVDEAAVRLFQWQYGRGAAYRDYCDQRGDVRVLGWRDVPAMPVDAFKLLDLRTFEADKTVATFRTSGTTTGESGQHHFDDLTLYRAASMRAFGTALVPDGGRVRIVSLIPGVDVAPDSSLSQMVTWALQTYGRGDSVVDPTGAALASITGPALILGTAFGLADAFEARPGLRLPAGVGIMETGGFKGRRREVGRADLHALYARAGVPVAWVVGEYGMTELSSQWYDGVVGSATSLPRAYMPPPWARTRILDPVTMADVAEGDTGLLLHFDPMNRGSVQAILTADLGERRGAGFNYKGRATGAAVRGCSMRDERS